MVLVVGNLVFLSIYIPMTYRGTPVGETRNIILNKWNYWIGFFFYLLFALILLSVIRLITLLKQQQEFLFRDGQKEQLNFFKKHICQLWMILIVFNTSYLMRGIVDQMPSDYMPEFKSMMLNLVSGLCFDCFPVSFLLYFHYRNFNKVSIVEAVSVSPVSNSREQLQ